MRGDAHGTVERLAEARAIAGEIGATTLAQSVLDVAAAAATLAGDWERTAILFGAAERGAEVTGTQRDAADASFLLPRVEDARRALGAGGFAEAEAKGRALAPDAALALACERIDDATDGRHTAPVVDGAEGRRTAPAADAALRPTGRR